MNLETVMMRDVLAETLIDLAAKDNRIVYLDSDLLGSSGMGKFAAAHPERFVNVGIAEANMIGTAAGLAATGMIPFCHSFGPFASRRAADQIYLSACYTGLGVNIIGTDPGVLAAYNGGTHMPFEDMSCLRGFAGIQLVEPTDSVMLRALLPQIAADTKTTVYLRLQRKNAASIYQPGETFQVGKAKVLREGKDVTLIASGIMVAEALKAAAILEDQKITAQVLDSFTWKPMDEDTIAAAAAETGAIVTCENHNILGGLGSAVAEVVCRTVPCPIEFVGVQDERGEVGPEAYLRGRYGLNAVDIAAAACRVVARKTV